jgi:hypothetical protein
MRQLLHRADGLRKSEGMRVQERRRAPVAHCLDFLELFSLRFTSSEIHGGSDHIHKSMHAYNRACIIEWR